MGYLCCCQFFSVTNDTLWSTAVQEELLGQKAWPFARLLVHMVELPLGRLVPVDCPCTHGWQVGATECYSSSPHVWTRRCASHFLTVIVYSVVRKKFMFFFFFFFPKTFLTSPLPRFQFICLCACLFIFFGHSCGLWKFPGQGSNPRHSGSLYPIHSNAGSLTHCATGERHVLFFFFREENKHYFPPLNRWEIWGPWMNNFLKELL